MLQVATEAEAARSQLERILGSPGFARNDRLSRFLRFVVERHLEGRDQELKESVIAVEVFGRSPDFNSKRDPIVRTEAARLRARLGEYYLNGGRGDPLVIDLPKGGYTPVLRQPEVRGDSAKRSGPVGFPIIVALVCAVVALGGAVIWRVRHQSSPIPIAVLPLENPGHDAEGDYFSDGLTSEIIRDLSIIDGLTVRSQTSSFALKDKPRNIRRPGRSFTPITYWKALFFARHSSYGSTSS